MGYSSVEQKLHDSIFNWALRIWLNREKGDQDYEYVRVVEGRGGRDVVAAEKMKVALLEEFSNILQSGEFRDGV